MWCKYKCVIYIYTCTSCVLSKQCAYTEICLSFLYHMWVGWLGRVHMWSEGFREGDKLCANFGSSLSSSQSFLPSLLSLIPSAGWWGFRLRGITYPLSPYCWAGLGWCLKFGTVTQLFYKMVRVIWDIQPLVLTHCYTCITMSTVDTLSLVHYSRSSDGKCICGFLPWPFIMI